MWHFGLVGSLAGWELRRSARRGQATRVRLVLLYTLFLTVLAFAAYWFQPLSVCELFRARSLILSPSDATKFAEAIALVLLEAQLAAVVAITPAFAASAVSEEKDRRTLPLLLTTLLTDREIVFGKAVGQIVFVLAALLAGVPVLMITQLYGGVDVGFLAAGYAITTGTVVLCVAIGVNAACHAPDLRSAILRAYGRVAVVVCGSFIPLAFASPFGVLAVVARDPISNAWFYAAAFGYPLLQALVGVVFLVNGVRSLRLRDATAGPPPVTAYPQPPKPADPPLLLPEHDAPRDLPPLDAADPVLWKERCVSWRPAWAMPATSKVAGVVAATAAALLFVGGAWTLIGRFTRNFDPAEAERLAPRPGPTETGGWLLLSAGVFAAGRYLLPLAVGVSGAIAGERFRNTLDILLSTTLDRRAILRAKVQAYAERGTVFAAVAVAAIGMAFIADAGIRAGLAAAVLASTGIAFVLALGSWLTVRCSGDVRAFRLLLPVTMLVVSWPVAAWSFASGEFAVPPEVLFRGFLIAAGVCAVVAAVLWWRAGSVLSRGE